MKGSFHTISMRLALSLVVGSSAAVVHAQESTPSRQGHEQWILEGVIVADNPGDSVALIRYEGATRARVLRVGDSLGDFVLASVAKSSVRLQSTVGELRLSLGRAAPDASVRTAENAGAGTLGSDPDDGWIRRAIPRAEAKERLRKEMPVILRETDFEPRVEEGEVRGLSVAHLPDGTLLSECGLLPGDLLVSVNGEPLRGIDSLWELLSRLLDEREIRVIVRRHGEVVKMAYALVN